MKNIHQTIQVIRQAKTIIISGHKNPDGDSIGSLLALGLGLEQLKKKVYFISQDYFPKRYIHLPGVKKIIKTTKIPNIDLAISVDCSTKEVIGNTFSLFQKAKTIIEIDHHSYRRSFGHIKLINTKAAAVGEIIYHLLKKMNISITHDIAENLLTSIIVETNSFRLPHLTPRTFSICSQLIKTGIDFSKLSNAVYWSHSKPSILLSGHTLSHCQFLNNNKIVWSLIRLKDYKKYKAKKEDADHLPEELRSIQGIKAAVLFREESDKKYLRVSLRSKGELNIAQLAEKHHGGGHFDSAGCMIINTKYSMQYFLSELIYLMNNNRLLS